MKLSWVMLLTMVVAGCGGYGSNYKAPGSTSMPATMNISALVPGDTGAGAPSFMLTINGSGFSAHAVIFFNGAAQPTTFVSPTQVTTLIAASQVASSAILPVYVRLSSGSGMYGSVMQNSNTMNFTVN
jgi:hypothetical protein